ncbi:MAG: hypothetical protein K6B46_00780 [Opitutales bacterium]|nr:hypothetical protein [Opitutales bacterium]
MNRKEIEAKLLQLVRYGVDGGKKERKYFIEPAYTFVMDALDRSSQVIRSKNPSHGKSLSGQELAAGVCDFAKELFGPYAWIVFKDWGFLTTRDIGEAVYGLIDVGIFFDDPKDKIEDFDNLFDIPTRLRL